MIPGWVEIIIRSSVAFVLLIIASKLVGKKAIAQYSFFEAASTMIIGVILAIGSFHIGIPVSYSLVAIIFWITIVALVNYVSLKSISFRNLIDGQGVPIIKDGKVLEDNLKKQRYTTDDLLKQLRAKNVFKVADVEFAVLEASGDINVLLKKENQPLTAKDMQIPVSPIKEPETVIMDGKVMDESLATLGFSRGWLEGELDAQGIAIENVFLGQVDNFGQLTVDLFDDKLKVTEPKEKPLLLSSIKKTQAVLEIFALQTENQSAKKVFSNCAMEMEDVLKIVRRYLL